MKEHTKMEKKLFRIRFEPIDVTAYSPEEALFLFNQGYTDKPRPNRVYRVDNEGLPYGDERYV